MSQAVSARGRRLVQVAVDRPAASWLLASAAGSGVTLAAGLPCPFRAFTGFDCPVCGATRAVGALLRGHIVTAAQDNLLLLMVLALGAILAVPAKRTRALAARIAAYRYSVEYGIVVLVLWTVLRNLPSLHWLAPDR